MNEKFLGHRSQLTHCFVNNYRVNQIWYVGSVGSGDKILLISGPPPQEKVIWDKKCFLYSSAWFRQTRYKVMTQGRSISRPPGQGFLCWGVVIYIVVKLGYFLLLPDIDQTNRK